MAYVKKHIDTSGGRKRSEPGSLNGLDGNSEEPHTAHESDDVHSLCSSLSSIPSLKSSASRKSTTSSIHTEPLNLPKHPCFRRFYSETGVFPAHPAGFSTIRIDRSQVVQEYVVLCEYTTFKKQAARGSNNPWRRYGPLAKLHEIGGYAPGGNDRKDRKNRRSMQEIKRNSKPPPAPTTNQMVLSKIRTHVKVENRINLQVPKNMDVESSCQMLAKQLKAYVVEYGQCLMKEIKNDTSVPK